MEEQNVTNNVVGNQGQNADSNLNQNVAPVNPVAMASQPMTNVENMPQVKYAGFWIRWVAIFIDGIVVAIMAIPIMIAFYFLLGDAFFGKDSEMPVGFNLLGYIISWSYYVFMTDKYQATLGKKAVGIMVVTENFQKASLGNIILRETVGKIISGIILCIGYLMVAFTDRKRALHDMISGTVVIYKDSNVKDINGAVIEITDKAKKTKTAIIIRNVIFGFLLLPSLFMSAMSVMMFDAPGSENSIYTIMLFSSVVSFPLLVILSIPVSWVAYRFQKYNLALVIASLPLLSILFVVLFSLLLTAVCNGQFAC